MNKKQRTFSTNQFSWNEGEMGRKKYRKKKLGGGAHRGGLNSAEAEQALKGAPRYVLVLKETS